MRTLPIHPPNPSPSPNQNHHKSYNYLTNSNTYLTHPQPYLHLATPIIRYTSSLTPPLSTSALTVIPIIRSLKLKNKSVTCCPLASYNRVGAPSPHLYSLSRKRMACGDVAWTTAPSTLSQSRIDSLCQRLTNFWTILVKLHGFLSWICNKDSTRSECTLRMISAKK